MNEDDLDQQVTDALQSVSQKEIHRRREACDNLDVSWKRWKDYYQSAWDAMVHAYPQSSPQVLAQMAGALADAASGAVDERLKAHIQEKFIILTTGQRPT